MMLITLLGRKENQMTFTLNTYYFDTELNYKPFESYLPHEIVGIVDIHGNQFYRKRDELMKLDEEHIAILDELGDELERERPAMLDADAEMLMSMYETGNLQPEDL